MNTTLIAGELLRIARDVMALELKNVLVIPSGTLIVPIVGKYPKYFIIPSPTGDRKTATHFNVYEIRTHNDMVKQLLSPYLSIFDFYDDDKNELAEAQWKKTQDALPPTFFDVKNMSVHDMSIQYGGSTTKVKEDFLRFLTDITRTDYVEIEKVLNSPHMDSYKTIVKKHEKLDLAGLYDFMVGKLKMNRVAFEGAFGRLPDETTIKSQKALRMGKWEVWWSPDTDLEESVVSGILGKVEGILGKKGMDKLCYGVVTVVKMRGGKGMHKVADYTVVYDSVRLSNEITNTAFVDWAFVHELGHRYSYRFMSTQKKSEVAIMYSDIKGKDALPVLIGETIQEVNSETEYVIKSVVSDRIMIEAPDKKMYSAPKDGFDAVHFKYKNVANPTYTFPSGYSRTNVEEFFAECFVQWCHGTLKGNLGTWFDGIMS